MVHRHSARKFCFMLGAAVEGHVDGYFLFSDGGRFDLRGTLPASSTWSGTEYGRFTEGKLKPAQEDSVEVIGFDGRVD